MGEEEMKAVDYWKNYMEILHWNTQLASEHYMKVLLDLIEKQSKEIEELKEKNEYLPNWVSKKYVSKAKIKEKIEEVEIELENYAADKINVFSGQTYMEKFKLLGKLYILKELLEE